MNSREASGLAVLRRFARQSAAPETEYCDLCAAPLPARHDHLLDPRARKLSCACQPCAILFNSTGETIYRRVPRDVRRLNGFHLTEQMWAALGIPIGLVFLFHSSVSGQALAVYPSPAGPTEAEIEDEIWGDLAAENPELVRMSLDVEALLINRINGARDYFIAPIDECYKLTGIVRRYWRGFTGGEEAWSRIDEFFGELKSRAI